MPPLLPIGIPFPENRRYPNDFYNLVRIPRIKVAFPSRTPRYGFLILQVNHLSSIYEAQAIGNPDFSAQIEECLKIRLIDRLIQLTVGYVEKLPKQPVAWG